ncbi:unnamed protein product [Withania somnifera]
MADSKVGAFTFLLLCVFLLGGNNAEAQICPAFCDSRVDYMICPSSGDTKLRPTCINCCQATARRCKLFRKDDSAICT